MIDEARRETQRARENERDGEKNRMTGGMGGEL